MRTFSLVGPILALLALASPARAGELPRDPILYPEASGPMMGREIDGAVTDAFKPAYQAVEGFSDKVYDFMRSHFVKVIFPGRLSRNLKEAPGDDSSALFSHYLHEKESRYMQRARESYPVQEAADGRFDQSRVDAWRAWAQEEQVSVVVDSLRDTLMDRYQMEYFGKKSGDYALDRRNWDPGFLTMASILGGGFLYLNGMHAKAHMGGISLGIDLRAGETFLRALRGGGDANGLAGVEVGYKNKPITLAAEWGASHGNLRAERYGVNYRLRY